MVTSKRRNHPYARRGAILLVAALAGCDRPAPAPAQPAATAPAAPVAVHGPERLVLAFGDSLYAGYRLKGGESLPDELERRLRAQGIDAKVVNAGVSGDTTADGRARLKFTLDRLPRAPDLVVLGLGGNDVLRQLPVATTRANLEAMLDELKRRGLPVVLTGMMAPPNLGPDYAQPFDALYPALAKRYGAELDPFILAGVIGNRRLMLDDGLHPNAKGVGVIGARLAPVVAARLSKDAPPAE